jgi:hypothetical protein
MAVVVLLLVLALLGAAALVAVLIGMRQSLEAKLAETGAELRRVADGSAWRDRGTDDLRREVSGFRDAIERLRVREEERRGREEQAWGVLQRVSAVLAGGYRTGRAGENVLLDSLGHLPPTMLVRDFRVGGRVVEFGLVLPDGSRLPIDSKWPAERELVALAEATDPQERDRLIRIIERTVADRAREVAGYLDPSVTASVAVAAVPDAAYAVLRRAHADAYRQGVIVIPYSLALPVALFLHGIVGRFGSASDAQACLADLAGILDSVEATVENKVARATAMLANGSDELRAHVGRARSALSRGRADPALLEGLGTEAELRSRSLAGLPP